ncbi:hypothetical protein KJ693_09635 [bacterium]|nr:hypothetical protein [bacterium]MBU1615554.1 hypothetical protein [bacterium]
MIKLYNKLKVIAQSEYKDIVTSTKILGKRTIGSSKLRIFLKDQTYLDIWLSPGGKYSYHWEQRAQRGTIYRHDNAPDFPHIKTHPQHIHDGDEKNICPSYIDTNPTIAIKQVLTVIRQKLEEI